MSSYMSSPKICSHTPFCDFHYIYTDRTYSNTSWLTDCEPRVETFQLRWIPWAVRAVSRTKVLSAGGGELFEESDWHFLLPWPCSQLVKVKASFSWNLSSGRNRVTVWQVVVPLWNRQVRSRGRNKGRRWKQGLAVRFLSSQANQTLWEAANVPDTVIFLRSWILILEIERTSVLFPPTEQKCF